MLGIAGVLVSLAGQRWIGSTTFPKEPPPKVKLTYGIFVMGGTLATRTIKMCPFGGTDPQDRGLPARRHGRQGGLGGLLAGVVVFVGAFVVWGWAVHPRHCVTPPPAGDRFFALIWR